MTSESTPLGARSVLDFVRMSTDDEMRRSVQRLIAQEIPQIAIAKRLGVDKTKFNRWLNRTWTKPFQLPVEAWDRLKQYEQTLRDDLVSGKNSDGVPSSDTIPSVKSASRDLPGDARAQRGGSAQHARPSEPPAVDWPEETPWKTLAAIELLDHYRIRAELETLRTSLTKMLATINRLRPTPGPSTHRPEQHESRSAVRKGSTRRRGL